MSAVRIRDEGPDVPEDLWPLQELLCQRPSRTVERRHEEQPLLRMNRYHARKQIEIVVHDVGMDGLRRHVNEPGPRLPQQEKEEEEALFVRLLARALNRALEAYRWYNDDRLRILADVVDGAPEGNQLLLKRLESSICTGWRGHECRSYPATPGVIPAGAVLTAEITIVEAKLRPS
jgi:hypothetical protein